MLHQQCVSEKDLAKLAKKYRKATGKTRAQAARDMGVAQTSIFNAEESPHMSLLKLRIRMIEKYSPLEITGPWYRVCHQGRHKK